MAGAIALFVVMLLVGPFVLFIGGALWSALLGGVLEADRREAGTPVDG